MRVQLSVPPPIQTLCFGQLSLAFPSSVLPTSCPSLLRDPLVSLLLEILDFAPVTPWSPPWWGIQPPSWPCQLQAAQYTLTLHGLLGGCGCHACPRHAKCFAHLSYGRPRRSVSWLLTFTEETRGGQVGPLPAQEVAMLGLNVVVPNVYLESLKKPGAT